MLYYSETSTMWSPLGQHFIAAIEEVTVLQRSTNMYIGTHKVAFIGEVAATWSEPITAVPL